MRHLIIMMLIMLPATVMAIPTDEQTARQQESTIDQLEKPLYNPFVERYFLDELKSLRTDLQAQRTEFVERFTATELGASDRAINYATSTVNNIFYIIAAAASILALAGWSSIREVRHKLDENIDSKVASISKDYEQRLLSLEKKLKDRTDSIIAAQEDITRTNTLHSLWMRAGLEATHQAKIDVYDQIIALKPDDVEALTYKADEVLEMGEAQWAFNLCNQALLINPQYPYALYQRACANATLNHLDAAFDDLKKAIELSSTYIDEAKTDKSLENLRNSGKIDELLANTAT